MNSFAPFYKAPHEAPSRFPTRQIDIAAPEALQPSLQRRRHPRPRGGPAQALRPLQDRHRGTLHRAATLRAQAQGPRQVNMDHNVETATFEDFDNRPLKKTKCSGSGVLDDLLPSPSISASSLVSECSETKSTQARSPEEAARIGRTRQRELPELVSSECSETKLTLSPVSDLINEEKTSEDDDKQTISADDDKQPDVPQHTNGGMVKLEYMKQPLWQRLSETISSMT